MSKRCRRNSKQCRPDQTAPLGLDQIAPLSLILEEQSDQKKNFIILFLMDIRILQSWNYIQTWTLGWCIDWNRSAGAYLWAMGWSIYSKIKKLVLIYSFIPLTVFVCKIGTTYLWWLWPGVFLRLCSLSAVFEVGGCVLLLGCDACICHSFWCMP